MSLVASHDITNLGRVRRQTPLAGLAAVILNDAVLYSGNRFVTTLLRPQREPFDPLNSGERFPVSGRST